MHDDDNIRSNHDWTPSDEEREAELERGLGLMLGFFAVLGVWKVLDVVVSGGRPGPFIAFLVRLFAALA